MFVTPECSLSSFYETIYRPLQLADASDSCRRQYERNIRRLDGLLGRTATIADLSDDLLARLCGQLIASGRSPGTANKIRSQLVAIWNFAARRGLTKTWPTLRKYREYRREPTAWTMRQLEELFAACYRVPGWIGPVRANLWWASLHALLWDSGLRIGAALKLEFSQVDFDAATLLIRAEQQKDREDLLCRLHQDTVALLRLIQTDRELIFHWPYNHGTLWNRYNRILRDANLPSTRRDKFHKLRRSTASWFKKMGGDPQVAMGHSSPEMTVRYVDNTITGAIFPADVLFRPVPSFRPDRPDPPRAA